ncbi:GGDEF domain-containing protein [Marinobacterium sedimentorum]|uniref:GGDEF domain-containing protein n=1 Tax=Marinobacterium sedimentorum TaxID=2927804 RepID=UPI0020C62F4B|nr:GGDEF domain-containing protein [Marinobacterium sedimentorum]MCP8688006.1 diguanylate cyclase [Marinobacterium sedimentorum]
MSPLDARYLRRKLLEAQHEQTPVALCGGAFVSACAGGYYWWLTQQAFYVYWLLAAALVILSRLSLYLCFAAWRRDQNGKALESASWRHLHVAGFVAAALSWAIIGLYVEYSLPFADAAFIYVCLAGMVAGSVVSTASVSPRMFLIFSAITLLPVALVLLMSLEPQKMAMGLVSAGFFVFSLRSIYRIADIFEGFVASGVVNEQLLRELRQEQRQVLKLNEQLREDIEMRSRTELQLRAQKQRAESLAEKLYALSSIDGLTEIPNRRYFDEHFAEEWSRALRAQSVLSLIICDIDYFKDFNDHYGHLMGDDCLRAVASTLDLHARRAGDAVTRFGGEEFAIILPGIGLQEACLLAEQMREAVLALGIMHAASKVSERVTISMGVACTIPSQEALAEGLLRRADEALYRAKHRGRNQVVSAGAV